MRFPKVLLAIVFLVIMAQPVFAAPALSNPRVTPTTAEEGATFTFTVHYKGDGAPSSVWVNLNGQSYLMEEVDFEDLNYTNGKDYEYRTALEAGTTVYFFKTEYDGETVQTAAQTVYVKESEGFEFTHLDVVLAVVLFLVPVIIALLYFRRISRDMHDLLEELRKNR